MKTCSVLQDALRHGVVAGAGIALLECRSTLKGMLASASDPDERAAYRILAHALEQPARAILSNAGFDPGQTFAATENAGLSHCCNVRNGAIVNAVEEGILDSAIVVKTAIQGAVRGAAQALTIDVLVHHRHPEESVTP